MDPSSIEHKCLLHIHTRNLVNAALSIRVTLNTKPAVFDKSAYSMKMFMMITKQQNP